MNGRGWVPIKLYLQTQVAGRIWLMGGGGQPLVGPANPYYGETCLWGGEGRPTPPLWLSWMKLVCKAPNLLRSEVP